MNDTDKQLEELTNKVAQLQRVVSQLQRELYDTKRRAIRGVEQSRQNASHLRTLLNKLRTSG